MPTWITPSGLISTASKGLPFEFALLCNTGNVPTTYQVIAGDLPTGITLSGPFNNPLLPVPSLWGVVDPACESKTFSFTVRASDSNGNISDRAFSLSVPNTEPSYIFPPSDLGIFPAAGWAVATVAPIDSVPELLGNISIVAGALPANLNLNSNTGLIDGFVDPSVLGVNSSVTFDFMVQYNSNVTANYSLQVVDAIHYPIFTQATYYLNSNTQQIDANINIGNIAGDSLYYQFETFDYDGDTINYVASDLDSVPGNFKLNTSTGWLSGFIQRDAALSTPYQFSVTAYKVSNANISTTVPVTLTIENPAQPQIVWTSSSVLGNLIPGVPSTLSIEAEIQETITAPLAAGAEATCTMKLVSIEIINGGTNFSNGNTFTISGGTCNTAATLTITSVSSTGAIQSASISPSIQQYSELPSSLNNIVWVNSNSAPSSYNAIINLNFGVDTINIVNSGNNYDTVTVGFGDAGQTVSASAQATVLNGGVNNATVTSSGENYQAVPTVVIKSKDGGAAVNPISYSFVSGSLPTGLQLLSNGLIVGIPSTQYFSLDQNTILDSNKTAFDGIFQFTVLASTATNKQLEVTESDISEPVAGAGDTVIESIQTLAQSQQTFTINLLVNAESNETQAPKSNLELEFLLDENSLSALLEPLNDENIVPNTAVYRPGDQYFGIASSVRMLMAYGISPVLPDNLVAAVEKYHHNKRVLLTDLQWAQSTTDGYEVIYIQPVDQFTNEQGKTFQGSIIPNVNLMEITVDTDIYLADTNTYRASDLNQYELFPATIPNMIEQLISTAGAFDPDFLPTWMTDVQPNGEILGFVPAIPLLYVKPGTGQKILFYLQQYYNTTGPNLNTIEAITDRYIWNAGYLQNWDVRPSVSVTGNSTVSGLTGASNFTVNLAIPLCYTANLTPITYTYSGNSIVSISAAANTVPGIVSSINAAGIDGFGASLVANNAIMIENTYGCPFYLYDGLNSPLQKSGILTSNSGFFSNIQSAGWFTNEITEFDVYSSLSQPMLTEEDAVLITESLLVLDTEGSAQTTFTDVPGFWDVSDQFLTHDEGSIYIKFINQSFINQPIVTV